MKRDFFSGNFLKIFLGVFLFLILSFSVFAAMPVEDDGPSLDPDPLFKARLDAEIYVLTEKDTYDYAEKIKLTAPRDNGLEKSSVDFGSSFDLSSVKGESVSYKKNLDVETFEDEEVSEEYDNGFIVQLEGQSLLSLKTEMIKASSGSSNLKSGMQALPNRELEMINQELDRHTVNLRRESDRIKSEVIQKIDVQKRDPSIVNYNLAFNGFYINVSSEDAEELKNIDGVKAVYPNVKVYPLLYDSVSLTGATRAWNYGEDDGVCPGDSQDGCYTGKGVTIGIVDGGVNYKLPDFGSCTEEEFYSGNCEKFIGGYNVFTDSNEDLLDNQGHGTHCASIAAANGDLSGVAPEAKIFIIKAMRGGAGSTYNIIESLESAIDLDNDGNPMENEDDSLDILSISLGSLGSNINDPFSLAVDELVESGVIVVVAVGNEGEKGYRTIYNPASSRKAISVGSHDKGSHYSFFGNVDYVSSFSSRGPVYYKDREGNHVYFMKPDVVAPGDSICAAQYVEGYRDNRLCFDDKHVINGGTSMATPHVAGIVALMKQRNPDLTPEEAKIILKQTTDIVDNDLDKQGSGKVDAYRAVLATPKEGSLKYMAEIKNVSVDLEGNVKVYGIAEFTDGYNYDLYYRSEGEKNWERACSGDEQINDGLICEFVPGVYGKYQLKLELSRFWFSKEYRAVGVFNYGEDFQILNLFDGMHFSGDKLRIIGKIYGDDYETHSLRYRKAGDSEWTDVGVVLNDFNSDFSGLKEFTLGSIDTSNFEDGEYEIVLSAVYDDGDVKATLFDYKRIKIFNKMKDGWGKKTLNFNPRSTIIYDINNDGFKEIILFDFTDTTFVHMYDYKGDFVWSLNIDASTLEGIQFSRARPVLADINGDSFKEIVFYLGSSEKIYSINKDGDVLTYPLSLMNFPGITAADLDRDGDDELIFKTGLYNEAQLKIWDDGEIIFDFNERYLSSYSNVEASVGNLDDDFDLEVIFSFTEGPHDTTRVFAYNLDGTLVDGWPVDLDGRVYVPSIIADVNSDSENEVVLSTRNSGTYLLRKNGQVIWKTDDLVGAAMTPFSIVDFGNDGFLEILLGNNPGRSFYVVDYNGDYHEMPFYLGETIALDMNSDKKKEFLSSRGIRGIGSFDKNGEYLPGFPYLEDNYFLKMIATDLENDGIVDLVAPVYKGIYVFELGEYDEDYVDWPMYQHDVFHSGNYNYEEESSQVQSPSGRDFSRIVNKEETVKGNLIMKLQKKGAYSVWNTIQTVIEKDVVLNKGEALYLGSDPDFGWNHQTVRGDMTGKYRVYVKFENKEKILEEDHEFSIPDTMQCGDSDYEDYSVAGYGFNITGNYYDACVDENNLKEYICENGSLVSLVVECNCVDGACVNESLNVSEEVTRPAVSDVTWSEWFNTDNSGGEGDFEYLSNSAISSKVCEKPLALECETIDGKGYKETGEVVHASLSKGCYCVNSEQDDGVCNFDYRVRFLCPADLVEQKTISRFVIQKELLDDYDGNVIRKAY